MRLLESRAEAGALLLERLDPDRSLHDVDLWTAAAEAGRLIRRLAIPVPPGLQPFAEAAGGIAAALPGRQRALGDPVPRAWLDAARGNAADLAGELGGRLVHTDLHYGNILAGEREPWLAVDPRPVNGGPELSVPELLWTRADELDGDAAVRRLLQVLVEAGSLRADVARAWAVTRCVDYWLWGLENGLTVDPVRCERVLTALLP